MSDDLNESAAASVEERQRKMVKKLLAWQQRAVIAGSQKQADVMRAALKLATAYETIIKSQCDEPDVLVKANLLRKRIEASEQHRTMAAEHNLSNEAIDATYEIQEMEKQLVELVLTGPLPS